MPCGRSFPAPPDTPPAERQDQDPHLAPQPFRNKARGDRVLRSLSGHDSPRDVSSSTCAVGRRRGPASESPTRQPGHSGRKHSERRGEGTNSGKSPSARHAVAGRARPPTSSRLTPRPRRPTITVMPDARHPLPHRLYRPPPLPRGGRTCCLLRDCDVVITSWTPVPIPWPRCQALDQRGGSGPTGANFADLVGESSPGSARSGHTRFDR
jgi:hypothetical protein